MRFDQFRLGPKLNLSLAAFMIVLGAATAGLVLFGFERSQNDATAESREGLETVSRDRLRQSADTQAFAGQTILRSAEANGVHAANFMVQLGRSGGGVPWDASRLAPSTSGSLHDPDPRRRSDVWVPASVALDDRVRRDLAESAALEALFPSMLAHNTDAVAMYFTGVSAVTRYYPAIGLANRVPPDVTPEQAEAIASMGPERNPDRASLWVGPYDNPAGSGLLLTSRTPVYDDTSYRGFIGIDLSLSALLARVDGIRIEQSGYAFLLGRDGELLPSDSAPVVQAAIDDPENDALRNTLAAMRAGSTGVDRAELEGREVFIAYAPYPEFGGSIALLAPIDELTAQAAAVTQSIEQEGNRTVAVVLATMLGMFILALFLAAWLNRRLLLNPIGDMVKATRRVAAGELNTTIPVTSTDELGMLADSFNRMTTDIWHRNTALEAEIAERERAQAELSAVFAAMSDVVLVLDQDGTYVRAAPTMPSSDPANQGRARFLIGRTLDDLFEPEKAAELLEAIRQALASSSTRNVEYSVDLDGRQTWFAAAISPMNEESVVWVARDITEQVEAERLLERRVDERTRELQAMLSVSASIASTLALEPLAGLILDQLKAVTDFSGASILTLEGDELVMLHTQAPGLESANVVGLRIPLSTTPGGWQQLSGGQAVIIDDVQGDTPAAREFRAALEGPARNAFAYVRSWLGVPLMLQDRVLGVLSMSRDTPGYFTDQHLRLARAIADQAAVAVENARLYEQARGRTSELEALLEISHSIASTLTLGPLAGLILDQLKTVTDFSGASIFTLDGDSLVMLESRTPAGPGVGVGERYPVSMWGRGWELLSAGRTVLIDDVRDSTEASEVYRAVARDRSTSAAFAYVRAWMAMPLMAGDRILGVLSMSSEKPGYFNQQHARLARAVADQAAVAIENARLFDETQQRARDMEALFRADAELFRSLSLQEVFLALCDVVVDLLGADKCMVTTIEDASGRYSVLASRGLSEGSLARMAEIRAGQPRAALGSMTAPIVNEDVQAAIPELVEVFEAEGIKSTIDVPFRSANGLLGSLAAAYTMRHTFGAHELRMLQAIADRAGVAIQNAELYERAQQAASLEERQRLARELHDSVSQALYGIALGARTARTHLDNDPERAVEPLEYVLSLSEAGLAEMRALIFELRPESLETEGLIAAIEKRAASARARHGIDVQLAVCDEPDAPLKTKEAFSRIAQEALHNIVKHARATHVDVSLCDEDGALTLDVRDDGTGFNPNGDFPGHLGLRSMRERITRLGGTFEIESAPGKGTRIRASLPLVKRPAVHI